MAQNTGTIVGAPIVTPDSLDNFPTAYNKDIQGGWKVVQTVFDRDAIPIERREKGMEVKVIAEGKTFELNEPLTNLDWIEVVSSSESSVTPNQVYYVSLEQLGVTSFALVTPELIEIYASSLNLINPQDVFIKVVAYIPEVEINFDITSSNWNKINSAASLKSALDAASGGTDTLVTNFSLENGRLKCYLENIEHIVLKGMNITEIHMCLIDNLLLLDLTENNISFIDQEAMINMDSLVKFSLSNNSFVDYSLSMNWAMNLSESLNGTIITFLNNPSNVEGTDFKAILISKGYL